MKTIKFRMLIPLLLALLFVGCNKQEQDTTLEKARTAMLKRAYNERDEAEKKAAWNARRVLELEAQVSILENRLEIANDLERSTRRLLDDSNARELQYAKRLIGEIKGK